MNLKNGKNCSICGGLLEQTMIERGFLFIGNRLFQVKNYPGYICSDCKEEHIEKETKELFLHLLSNNLFEPHSVEKVPVYDFGLETVENTQTVYRFDGKGNVYCIQNVPYTEEETGVRFVSKTLQHIKELHKRIEKKEIKPTEYLSHITVYAAQKK